MALKPVIAGFVNIPASSGSGATIPNTTNLIKGDGSGNGADSGVTTDTDGTLAANSDAKVSTQKATKTYVDTLLASFDAKPQVGYASTSALPSNNYDNGSSGVGATLTGTSNGPLLIDSVTLAVGAAGQRILVAGESASANNGWYTVTQVGVVAVSPYILTRATESDTAAEIGAGYLTSVIAPNNLTPGTANNGKVFISIAADPFTVGTTAITFGQVGTANQNTTGSAASLSVTGQTGLLTVVGLTSTNRAKTVRDAADTLLELAGSYTPTGTWTGLKTTGQLAQAGTTSVAPILFDTTGAKLTSATAGALEVDPTGIYFTNNTTSGRAQIPDMWHYYTTGDGSASGTATITDMFPANSSFPFVLNGIYEFIAEVFYTKTTSGTMVYTLTNTQNFTSAVGEWIQTPAAGISGGGATSSGTVGVLAAATIALPATASLTGPTHWARITFKIECGTAGNIRLRGTPSAGTFTLLRGSMYTVRRLSAATIGAFVA